MIENSAIGQLQRTFEAIDALEPKVKAWVHLDRDSALETARRLDKEREERGPRGKLHGLPIGVKDVIDVAGMPTRNGSAACQGAKPAAEDSGVVRLLRAAGCNIIGKLKTTEFAYLDPSDARNPLDVRHTPGGSSSGSGAAVGAGMVPLALGTQTAGSVCRPAAFCGVTAFKPTNRLIATSGVTAFATSFDTVGFIARDIETAVLAAATCAGSTDADAWTLPVTGCMSSISPPDIILPSGEYFQGSLTAPVSGALAHTRDVLLDEGVQVREVDFGLDFQRIRDEHRVVMFYEAARSHPELLHAEAEIGENWKRAITTGWETPTDRYNQAREYLIDARRSAESTIGHGSLVLVPTAHELAPEGIESTGDARMIVPWTAFGSPMAVLPILSAGSKLHPSVMVVGPAGADKIVAEMGGHLERWLAE